MKAKDTVMRDNSLFIQFHHDGYLEGEVPKWIQSLIGSRVKEIAEQQTEFTGDIMFKAGQKSELKCILNDLALVFATSSGATTQMKDTCTLMKKYEAKLKEWSIP